MKILSFFLFLGVIFALLDPDPQFVCGSGSEIQQLKLIRIHADPDPKPWIQNSDPNPQDQNCWTSKPWLKKNETYGIHQNFSLISTAGHFSVKGTLRPNYIVRKVVSLDRPRYGQSSLLVFNFFEIRSIARKTRYQGRSYPAGRSLSIIVEPNTYSSRSAAYAFLIMSKEAALWNRHYFLQFWFRLLKSYSGSGSNLWKIMVPVPTFEKLRFRYRFQLHI